MVRYIEKTKKFWIRVVRRIDHHPIEKNRWISLGEGESKREAERRARTIELALLRELEEFRSEKKKPKSEVFSDFVREVYLPRCASASNSGRRNRASTLRVKRDVLDNHIVPFFSAMRIDEIDQAAIDDFVRAQESATHQRRASGENYAGSTLAARFKVLRHVLNTARDLGLLDRVPRVPSGDPTPVRRKASAGQLASDERYAEDEVLLLLAEARVEGPAWFGLFSLLLRLGPRIGEALALRWDDIDFDRRTIHVCRRVYGGQLDVPKTGPREVSLHDAVAEALRDVPKRGSYVFGSERDPEVPQSPSTVRVVGKRIAARAGVAKGFRPHACRHTAASTFLAQGVPVAIVARWLGHSVRVLLSTYAHILAPESHAAMLRVHFSVPVAANDAPPPCPRLRGTRAASGRSKRPR